MPISRKTSPRVSSYLPSSSSNYHPNHNAGNADNSFNSTSQQQQQQRLLNCQRKLRHLTDDEVGLRFVGIHHSFSSPCSPDTPAKKHSRSTERLEHWSSYAEPQPLPLPETFFDRKLKLSGSSPGPSKLASPNERHGRKTVDHAAKSAAKSLVNVHKKFSQDKPVESFTNGQTPTTGDTRTGAASYFSSPASPQRSNTQDYFNSFDVADSTKSLLSRRRGFPHEKNYGSVNYNLRLNVSARSAPTTAFSSPSVSPQRSRAMDPQESRGLIDLDVPNLGRAAGYTSPDKNERCPLHTPGPNNSLGNAHPLPLPPGALPCPVMMALLSSGSNHIIEKPIASSIISQWKKGKLLGRGTYGSVYEATNRETGALCAMKEVDIIPDDPKSLECIKQLEQEIRCLRHLNHRNIVQYYGSEIVDDHFYIYLEYVHPGSISKYVREHCGAITEPIVRNFTRHILSGLEYLHSSKTIHRDIKGANLLVDANGIVKLADFGMAKHLTGLSYDLSLKGSPYWMAPEVIKAVMTKDSNPNLAMAVDIWSLGCTVIEMFNGKPPWSDLEGPQALFKVLNKSPSVPEALSPEGKDFLHCCFKRNPAERPSAAMLLEHPFVRNSVDQNGADLLQAFSRMNLTAMPEPINVLRLHTILSIPLEVSTNTSSHNTPLGAVNNYPFSVGQTQGKEVWHI